MQRVDEFRLDGFPMQELPADRRWIKLWIKFGIGSLVLALAACGLIVPDSAAWALFLATVVFIAQVVTDADRLPIRVASHFAFDLLADGWMNRSSHRLVVMANRTDPPRLAKAPFFAVIATVPIALAMSVAAIVSQIP
jgi:hypothetical protein